MSAIWPENQSTPLAPEEIIEWLERYRRLMFEIWENNPDLYVEWVRLNQVYDKSTTRNTKT